MKDSKVLSVSIKYDKPLKENKCNSFMCLPVLQSRHQQRYSRVYM